MSRSTRRVAVAGDEGGVGLEDDTEPFSWRYAPAVDVLALVPGALGIALSPLPVASVVFLLGHRRGPGPGSGPGRVRGPGPALACALGWTAAIVAGLVAAVLVGERLPSPRADGPPVQAIVALCAAGLLFVLAGWQWARRTLPDGSPASERWSAAMEAVGPGRAFGLGALLFVSPKSVVLVLAAGLVFGDAGPSAPLVSAVAAGFVVVAASTVFLPILLAVALGDHARRALAAMRAWIARWGARSLVVVLVTLGVVQLVTGLSDLR